MKEREQYIDIAKIIGIFLVICGHYVYFLHIPQGGDGVYLWNGAKTITLFHMPLFFLISGYLYRTPSSWNQLFTNSFKRLIVPYLSICATTLLVGSIVLLITKEWTLNKAFDEIAHNVLGILTGEDFPHARMIFSSSMWFVYSLVMVRLVYYAAECIPSHFTHANNYIKALLCVIGVIGLYIGNVLPFRLDSSIIGLLFFVIGDLSKNGLKKLTQTPIYIKMIISAGLLGMLAACAYLNLDYHNGYGMSINIMNFGTYLILFLLSGVAGSYFILLISSMLPQMKSILVEHMSNNTIIILGFHEIIMLGMYLIIFSQTAWYIALGTCVTIFVICNLIGELFKKYIPAYIGWR